MCLGGCNLSMQFDAIQSGRKYHNNKSLAPSSQFIRIAQWATQHLTKLVESCIRCIRTNLQSYSIAVVVVVVVLVVVLAHFWHKHKHHQIPFTIMSALSALNGQLGR